MGWWIRLALVMPVLLATRFSLAADIPPPLPADIPLKTVTGVWQFIPVPLPEQNITHLTLSRGNDRLFLGTREGVASYDGVAVRVPEFEPVKTQQSIIVNSMVEVGDGAVIIGSANDSLWRWKDNKLSPLYGACPRGGGCPTGDWALTRSDSGTLYAVSSRYTLRETEALSALRAAVKETVVPVAASASFLGFAGDNLVAVSQNGDVSIIDKASGEPSATRRFDVGPNAFVRNVSFSPDQVLAGTDAKCVAVPLDPKKEPTELASRNCTAIYRQADGTTWLSTNALYRNESKDWAEWSPGSVGSITANSLLEDGMSNVWVASTTGLWRYLDLSREYRFSVPDDRIASLIADNAGGVFVGMVSGAVWLVDRELGAKTLLSPTGGAKPQSAYYRGALLGQTGHGALWSLSADGLFRIEKGAITRITDYPLPMTEGARAVASFAVSAAGQICAGLNWSTEVLCLTDGKWELAVETLPYFGGSSIGAVGFDDQGSLMAVGPVSISIKGASDLTLGPFEPSPFGKVNGFGAITTLSDVVDADAVVSGGWGRTIFLKKIEGTWSAIERSPGGSQDQPYLIRSFAVHPNLGLMAATDAGVYRWEGSVETGKWRSLREIDPRLGSWVDHIVPGEGNSFWIGAGPSLTRITLPVTEPTIDITGPPESGVIESAAIAYHFNFPGLVGLPDRKVATVTYDPEIPNAIGDITGPTARIDLSGLADQQSYKVRSVVTDGFLNRGKPVESEFSVRLPFYQNPYKLSLAVLALVALPALLVTRRGPTGFLLRRVGGLRWSTAKADPQLSLEIDAIGNDAVRFELEAPAAVNLIRLAVDVPIARVEGLPKEALPFLVSIAEGQADAEREEFDSALQRVSEVLYDEALPESVRFTTGQFEGGAMSLDLSKSLLWFPLELASDGQREPLLLRYAIGRTVSGDTLAEADGLRTGRLKVAIVAPQLEPGHEPLPHVKAEALDVAKTVRAWGAEVIMVSPAATKAAVLEALCQAHLFHYAGHAEFDPLDAGQSFLPLLNDRLTAQEVAEALSTRPNQLLLAFINGCGTSREASWERADDVYGFASAFLNNASFFIGSQWPIQDEFAAPFASAFYKELFPSAYGLWWRLIRRDELAGLSFAESLRRARHTVREMSFTSDQTWSSYIFYGDPTRRLVLA